MALEYTLRLANAAFLGPARQAQAALGGLDGAANAVDRSVGGVNSRFGGLKTAVSNAASATGSMIEKLGNLGGHVTNIVSGVQSAHKAWEWYKGITTGAATATATAASASASAAGAVGGLGSRLRASVAGATGLGGAMRLAGTAALGLGAAAGVAALGVGALVAAAAPILAVFTLVAGALKLIPDVVGRAANMEQLNTSFKTLIGNAAQTEKTLGNLRALAASTPFEFPEIAQAARSLVAFGEGAEVVHETLRRVGDVAAGVGAPLGEVASLYGKARVNGRLFAEDLNELQGRGIPIQQELGKIIGVTAEQVRELASEGKITFPLLDQAFRNLTSEGGKFANQMKAQSGTLLGLWSTLKDAIGETLTELGKPVVDVLKPMLLGAIAAADGLKAMVQALGQVFSAAGAIATAAWANGQMGQAIGNVITLGAKMGVNALVSLIYSIPARIQGALQTLASAISAAVAGNASALVTIFNNLKNIGKGGLLDTSKEEAALARLWQQGKAIQAQRERAGQGNAPQAGQADGLQEAIAKAMAGDGGKAVQAAAKAATGGESWRSRRPDGTMRSPTSADAAYGEDWRRESDGRSKIFGYSSKSQNPEAGNYQGIDGWKRLQERGKRMDNGKLFDDPNSKRVNDAFNKAGGSLQRATGALKDTFKTPALDSMKKLGPIGSKNVEPPGQMTKRQEREAVAQAERGRQQPRWDLVASIEQSFRSLAVG